MPLIFKDIYFDKTIIGVWDCTESEKTFWDETFLSAYELEALHKPHHAKRIIEKLATRRLAQELMKDFSDETYQGLKKLPTGKPVLIQSDLEISVSHCKKYVTVQLTKNSKAGIDIQNINKKIKTIAPRVFSKREIKEINNSELLYARCWSAKEAIFKYYEKGNINFIQDIHLHNIQSETDFYGVLTCQNEHIKIKLSSIQIDKDYQLIFCDENI